MSDTLYDSEFYGEYSAGSYLSAKKLLPLVLELIPAKSVLDVGCGIGTFLRAFIELGVSDVIGIDGEYVRRDLLQIPPAKFQASDLAKGFKLGRTFDLAISMEVAEHLPREASERFVHSLVQHSKVVLFSAAVPMQGGAGHINEQWASFWAKIFEQHGYRVYDPFRRSIWADKDIEVWYRQNTLVFASDDALKQFPNLEALMPSTLTEIDVVHPQMYIKPAAELHKLQEYLRASHIVEVRQNPNGGLGLRRK